MAHFLLTSALPMIKADQREAGIGQSPFRQSGGIMSMHRRVFFLQVAIAIGILVCHGDVRADVPTFRGFTASVVEPENLWTWDGGGSVDREGEKRGVGFWM